MRMNKATQSRLDRELLCDSVLNNRILNVTVLSTVGTTYYNNKVSNKTNKVLYAVHSSVVPNNFGYKASRTLLDNHRN